MIANILYWLSRDIFPDPGLRLRALSDIAAWRDRMFLSNKWQDHLLIWFLRPVLFPLHLMRDRASTDIIIAYMDHSMLHDPKGSYGYEFKHDSPIDRMEIK